MKNSEIYISVKSLKDTFLAGSFLFFEHANCLQDLKGYLFLRRSFSILRLIGQIPRSTFVLLFL